MRHRVWLAAMLISMPLCGWQTDDKPSPVPSKSRAPRPAGRTSEKSEPLPNRAAKPRVMSDRGRPPNGAPSEQTGQACFFSSSANGGLTASGKHLDSEELTAGHASFPLGSTVRVTNLRNQRSVEVTIIDRLPVSWRIINLSEAAARQLDFTKAGTTDVRLELLSAGRGVSDSSHSTSGARK